ncbi:GAF domain-containing sensor histidine kinase [Oleiharenicola lentus]|uniref:GAF domain-containing sensor histidine kinase n=1 Tax=Oleiharenicola lentus TaxID=2508720 RepID=UPI003F668476
MLPPDIQQDILTVSRISAVPSILKVVSELTGMRVTMVSRVTTDSWTACAAYDRAGFGLVVGMQLDLTTTFCKGVCENNRPVIIEHSSVDPIYRDHPTPKMYNIESYISIPIKWPDGGMFGTLCALDSRPMKIDPKVVASLTLFTELISNQLHSEEVHDEIAQRSRELELKIAERTAKLQETVSELETFSYSISHDMRGPLRAMQSFAHILLEECGSQLNDSGRDYVRRIIASADRMDRLIRDILVFSRVGPAGVAAEKIDLQGLIAGILESYPQFDSAVADIRIVGPLPAVQGSSAALSMVVSNLLDNAVKFTPRGTRPAITVWAETVGPRVRVFFKDNGVGIARDQWEKIFGIFYRLDQSVAGTGIGLSIVKKGVERMGGIVGLTSEVGKGSTFYLELAQAEN